MGIDFYLRTGSRVGFCQCAGRPAVSKCQDRKILIMFNVGVEIGQVVVVLMVLPILFYLSRRVSYRTVTMPVISWLAAVMASFWLGTRLGWWG